MLYILLLLATTFLILAFPSGDDTNPETSVAHWIRFVYVFKMIIAFFPFLFQIHTRVSLV